MTRRLEAGPILVMLGALLLAVSLFLAWFEPDITAWSAFEVWDLVLLALAVGCIAAGVGLMVPDMEMVDRRWLPAAVAAVTVIAVSQIVNPPPAAAGQDPEIGAWLALGSAALMCIGGLLTVGTMRIALEFQGREPRRRVAAVDARGPAQDTTESEPVVVPEPDAAPAERERRGGRLFARESAPAAAEEPVGARSAPDTTVTEPLPGGKGEKPREEKQD